MENVIRNYVQYRRPSGNNNQNAHLNNNEKVEDSDLLSPKLKATSLITESYLKLSDFLNLMI
jgi:hypothetical protein